MGANGFVGSRVVEMFYLDHLADVRPIVRSFSGLARLARFDLDCRLADATDEAALFKAFEGCEVLIHSVSGNPDVIEGTIGPTYRAATAAGIKRIVYISTASVFGQAPLPGTDDATPISDRQAQEYNNAKVRAEWLLRKEREKGRVETVILRPGIVFGPRDRWVSAIAREMLAGTSYLVDGGHGICNSIYVDNLVHAIRVAMTAEGADNEAVLVGDAEIVTWDDFYRRIAAALDIPFETVANVPPPEFKRTLADRVDKFRSLDSTQALLPIFPSGLKRSVKAALGAWSAVTEPSPWTMNGAPHPNVTMEMADLHRCACKLPHLKAEKILGYQPPVTFDEGLRRTIAWLRFAGITNGATFAEAA